MNPFYQYELVFVHISIISFSKINCDSILGFDCFVIHPKSHLQCLFFS
uniref:Uncharacterized protein n=1 Tax=Arundo donax TaxID=35708 RepID=A0A0A9BCQ4_ARUDO